jgi:hypothetical protein
MIDKFNDQKLPYKQNHIIYFPTLIFYFFFIRKNKTKNNRAKGNDSASAHVGLIENEKVDNWLKRL